MSATIGHLVGGPQDGTTVRIATDPVPRVQRFGDLDGEYDHYFLLKEEVRPDGEHHATYQFDGRGSHQSWDDPDEDKAPS
jgi:hypothetical protein